MGPSLIVHGQVVDARRHPVAAARIMIAHAPHPVPDIAVLSDEQGRFDVPLPGEGRYLLNVHADGLASGRLQIDTALWHPAHQDQAIVVLADLP